MRLAEKQAQPSPRGVELLTEQNQMAARGQLYSGALPRGLAYLKQSALHDYRGEMTRKRRRYRELCDDQGARSRGCSGCPFRCLPSGWTTTPARRWRGGGPTRRAL